MAKAKKATQRPLLEEPSIEFQSRCNEHDWDSHWQPTQALANQEASVHTDNTGHSEFTMVQRQMSFHSNLSIKVKKKAK